MDYQVDMEALSDTRIVYVRPVDAAELPDEVRAEIGDLSKLYAVHSEDGARLALVQGRKLAFDLARQNDFSPVPVH